ncbi:MAG: L-histidine N(alpha)-methyltransferase [Myxococcota bacterium]
MSDYRVLGPDALGQLQDRERDFADDVLVGLSGSPKRLSSRYFYDDEGSRLFAEIMDLDVYYPTDCEREVLTTHKNAIAELLSDRPTNVVDLGAGDGVKTSIVLQHLLDRNVDVRYVPIDISEGAMRDLVGKVRGRMPELKIEGLVCEYDDGLRWLAAEEEQRQSLVMFLGSNIGNFNRGQARAFLRRLWGGLQHGDRVLIGFDLKKDIDVLLRAYNDPAGVTAKFNLNLLTRINRELGGNFDTEKFRHFGTYDVFSGAMESYLVSLERQTVYIEAIRLAFQFDPWEPVHTEYSYKYLRSDVHTLAKDCGYTIDAEYLDDKRWFVDSVWRVEKGRR